MNTLHPNKLANEDANRVFDELAQEILNVADRIFPPASPINSSQATFTLSERAVMKDAGSGSFPKDVIVCPKARLHNSTTEKPKVFKCRCCCVGEPHANNLAYKRYSEVETISENICSLGSSPKRVFDMTVMPRTVEMIQNDWEFPSTKIVKVILHSSNNTTLIQKPSRVELKHFGVLQSPCMGKDTSQGVMRSLLPESYFRILSKGSQLDEGSLEVQVHLHTRICHVTNPLGRLVVTLNDTRVLQVIALGQQRPERDVDFYFDLREVKDKAPQISQRGLSESLQDLEIWISDYDESGKSIISQMSWAELIQRGIKSRNIRATFIKSETERTAGDWLDEVDDLIRAMRGDKNDRYERVKIAIIDSGLHDRERSHYRAEYKDFTGVSKNDSWHGTCCAGIIQGMYEEARLFIARVFERDHADEIEGPLRMARAIHWAIEPQRSVDIISISAGFRNYSKELDDAVTKAKAAGVLVIAAASNWQNTNTVAFPARHNLSTMCIYSTNTGNQSSSFNPEPRADTQNFAIIGEGFQHPDQRRNERMSGTSMATAVAAGLAARIVDFSRQKDNKASIFRAQDVGKLPGMLSIFSTLSKPAGNLRYVSPLELLPLRHGVSQEADRQRVREVLSQAMERAN
ncbi:hypothetical protein H9Q74_006440 [Fusarium xylarioides]|nr:hypothetical protein H9Q71_006653 [Fusarium xylarioides]KAG5823462.1 hypothetical protein H9Q74_006440 [Fusarium xylarioides]